jgi:nicotinate phosphoribosyltransferase
MSGPSYALHTDLYQLTMAAGYFLARKTEEIATFELFVRRLPPNREFLVAAGLAQAVDYLLNLRFTPEQVDYVRSIPQLAQAPPEFFAFLSRLRFTGDLFAMLEGTPFLAGEPIAIVRAPIIQAQLVETFLLGMLSFQSLIATKAGLLVDAASGRSVVEFGSRRAHSPEAGVLAGRAAFVGGCAGTSNVEAGHRYGIPVFGTCAHSWIMTFSGERKSFQVLQKLLGPQTVYLLDTYDTLEGARRAAELGQPLWGVRLDSGDFDSLSRQVRRILDEAGLHEAKIMATGDLNERKIAALIESGAPIDSFGVGTELATSLDSPALGAVYKVVEVSVHGIQRFTAKVSAEKSTLPGAKQVFRGPDVDIIGRTAECGSYEPLLRPIILDGEALPCLPSATDARAHAASLRRRLKPGHRVEISKELEALRANWRAPE